MKFTYALAALVAFAAPAVAQSSSAVPSGISSISQCILSCLATATSQGGCSSFTDLQCVCTNTAFQTAAATCLQQSCTAADQSAALQLQQSQCASISSASTAPASATSAPSSSSAKSSTASSVKSSTSSPASSSTGPASSVLSSLSSAASSAVSTSPNAAAKAWTGAGAWGTVVVVIAGVLAGGALVV